MKITRRIFASLFVVAAPLLLLSSAVPEQKTAERQYLAYVGTYTAKTSSKGIYAYRYDASSGKLTPLGVAAETADPSFLAIHPNGKYLYAVNESGKSSMVSAFAVDAPSGKLTLLNQLPALGEDPCYISIDRSGKFVLVANYTSGNLAVFPVLADGKLGEHTALVQDSGTLGPNKERQEGPHAHWIETSPDNRFVLVADLGLDEVLIYRFDAKKGVLSRNDPSLRTVPLLIASSWLGAGVNPGAGPRHFVFHPRGKFGYVLNEMDATVVAFSYQRDNSGLSFLQTIATLPKSYSGRNDAAEIAIHPNGKFLYASNRGHDSITVFAIDSATGKLTSKGYVLTGGKEPRHFAIDPTGKFLFAENQLSDTIVTFRIDLATGQLSPTGESLSVPSPVDLVFLPEN